MKIRYLLSIVVLAVLLTPLIGSGVAASTPAKAVGESSADLPFNPAEVALISRNAVQMEGDALVADNEYRRVEFTAHGVRFAPREDGKLVSGHAVAYRLTEVRAGDHASLAEIAPVVPRAREQENQVDYARPAGVTERYVVSDRGLEQLFVLERSLALSGDLEVVGRFETTLTPELVDPLKGIRFLDDGADVLSYSGAVAYDAAGRETSALLRLDGDRVTITVPGDWLAGAAYPVTIDPHLEGGRINVAYITLDQDEPAVAYSTSSGQYLVVFEDSSGNGNILGRFVDAATGQLVGNWFLIADSTSRERNPDIAYDPYRDRFLVVYEDGNVGSRNIVSRLVYGAHQSSGSQILGALPTMIAGDSADEYDPAVAYNADNHQFAVVYLRSTYMVYGRMVDSKSTYPDPLGSAGFQIRNYGSGATHTPDVTWGSGGNTFLVTWHRERPSSEADPDYIAIAYLYDTYQGGGSQMQGSIWRMAPYDRGSDPLTKDCSQPAVAYDPVADAYVVVFRHFYVTGSYTIHGQRVCSQYNSSTFRYDADYAFPIETAIPDFSGHYQPDIAFSGTGDEMHVVYISYWFSPKEYWVHDRTLHGTSVGSRLAVRHSSDGDVLEDPAVAGAAGGRCLVVWREEDTPSDWDIFGQRIKSDVFSLFLPAVLKNH